VAEFVAEFQNPLCQGTSTNEQFIECCDCATQLHEVEF
jgi:hypothetical protein